jgi:hypothetical protein
MLHAMAMNERDLRFFRPLWVRILVTGIVAAWFLVETILSHDMLWIGITAAGVIYCIWNFFLTFPKDRPAGDRADPSPAGEPPKE